jgi:hypothetical protein
MVPMSTVSSALLGNAQTSFSNVVLVSLNLSRATHLVL